MPVACGCTTRKLGLLPLLLLLAPSARVRSSPRTYLAAAAAVPAGGAAARAGRTGSLGQEVGRREEPRRPGAAAGAPPAAAPALRLPPPRPAPRDTQGGPGRGTRGCTPRLAPAPLLRPTPWTPRHAIVGRMPALGLRRPWRPHFVRCRGPPLRATKGERGVVGSKHRGFNPVLTQWTLGGAVWEIGCPQGQAQCTRFAPWKAGRD